MTTEPRKRSYQPGFRTKVTHGKVSDKRWAWCQTLIGQFVIWVDFFEEEDGTETDEIKDLKLLHPLAPGRKPVTWNLSALTEEELKVFRELVNTAIDWAMPIARQRDKEAQDAFDNGDDSHTRVYRQTPQLVYRKRPKHEHREGVLDGPSDDAPAPRD